MKKYIFFTGNILNIGGLEIYIKNKVVFLKKNGWDVNVYSSAEGIITLKELKEYAKMIIPELKYYPSIYTKNKFESICTSILSMNTEKYDEVIIESHHINYALWAEIIASKLKGKHFIYSVTENYNIKNKNIFLFLDFKHKRKELAGIVDKSLSRMFNGFKELGNDENYYLKSMSENVVEDYSLPIFENIPLADYTIGSIGRLDKNYVNSMIDEIILFSKTNQSKSINLLLIGGSKNGNIEKIIEDKVRYSNINLLITGYIYPIPLNIFTIIDVFIASSGSAIVSCSQGVPTITLDANDYMPMGILGYTTELTLYRDSPPKNSISDLLNAILVDECCKGVDVRKIPMGDIDAEYTNHINFIRDSAQDKVYYNTSIIKQTNISLISKNIIKYLGIRKYKVIKNVYQSIRKK
jgi:frataxin-like iron-binding protein CyaY